MILDNIWLINLDQSKDRLKVVQNNFDELNLKFNRFSAIYGKNLSDDEIKKIQMFFADQYFVIMV